MEAFRSRNELLVLTSNLMKSNMELANRIAHLEDCFDTSNATIVRRPDSVITTKVPPQDANTRMQETTSALCLVPYNTATHDEQRISRTPSRTDLSGTNSAADYEFETILFSSRVYYGIRRQTYDDSYRSSMGLSHAWTAISEISLSDISKISVVALPLTSRDVSNQRHYAFRQTTSITEPTSDYQIRRKPLKGVAETQDLLAPVPMVSDADTGTLSWYTISPHKSGEVRDIRNITLIIKGSRSYFQFVEKVQDGY